MEMFYSTLSQMLMMFTLIAAGFVLRKCSILPLDSDTGMARAETFIFGPALYIGTQMQQCSVEMFRENYTLIIYGLIITVCAIVVSYPLCRIFIRKKGASEAQLYQQNVYKYALAFGNYGFMGNFIALTVFGPEFLNKYILFTFFVGILCLTWGLYVLVPKDQGQSIGHNIRKGLLNPMTIGLLLGMALGLLNVREYVPQFLLTALDQAGACQGPVAMILAGFVIGGYNFKELLLNKKVYLATAFRLVLIPAVMLLILRVSGASDELMILTLIAFGTPLGLNTIVFPAAYGGETKTGASMAMISHTLSVITIPLMYLVFIVLL